MPQYYQIRNKAALATITEIIQKHRLPTAQLIRLVLLLPLVEAGRNPYTEEFPLEILLPTRRAKWFYFLSHLNKLINRPRHLMKEFGIGFIELKELGLPCLTASQLKIIRGDPSMDDLSRVLQEISLNRLNYLITLKRRYQNEIVFHEDFNNVLEFWRVANLLTKRVIKNMKLLREFNKGSIENINNQLYFYDKEIKQFYELMERQSFLNYLSNVVQRFLIFLRAQRFLAFLKALFWNKEVLCISLALGATGIILLLHFKTKENKENQQNAINSL